MIFGFWVESICSSSSTMKKLLLSFTCVALMMLAPLVSASGESALRGWETTTSSGNCVWRVYMRGPTARNKLPEKKGVFKGEFFSREGEWQSKLTAIYKLSLDKKGELQSQKVEFRVSPVVKREIIEANGVKVRLAQRQFETANLSFEQEESFVLIFKIRDPGGNDETEMVMLRISSVFVPS